MKKILPILFIIVLVGTMFGCKAEIDSDVLAIDLDISDTTEVAPELEVENLWVTNDTGDLKILVRNNSNSTVKYFKYDVRVNSGTEGDIIHTYYVEWDGNLLSGDACTLVCYAPTGLEERYSLTLDKWRN